MTVRKVSDRTFLLHLGGKIEVRPEGAAQAPRRPVPRLHARGGPGLPGDRREPGGRPPPDHQAQHRRGRHRRVGGARAWATSARPPRCRSWRARPRCSSSSAGSTPGRSCWTPRTPTRSSRSSRRIAPGVRRDQPRGHRRAALLRDRGAGCASCSTSRSSTTTSTAPRSCVLAALTNALRVVGKQLADVRVVVSGVGAAGRAIIQLLLARASATSSPATATARSHPDSPSLDEYRRWIAEQHQPARRRRARWPRCSSAPTSSSGCPRRTC